MNHLMRILLSICLLLSASGCGKVSTPGEAQPLPDFVSYFDTPATSSSPPTRFSVIQKNNPNSVNRSVVGLMMADAYNNCQHFLTTLNDTQSGLNLGLDLATTALSAVGSVVAPISVARGFTTGATIATGSRAKLDADLFNQASIQQFAQAVSATFNKDMIAYNEKLNEVPSANDDTIVPAVEYGKIQAILGDCSLASALNTISATLALANANAPQSGGTTEQNISVSGTTAIASGSAIMTPATISTSSPVVKVDYNRGDSANDVVTRIADAFNAQVTSTGISAKANGNTLTITAPQNAPTWVLSFNPSTSGFTPAAATPSDADAVQLTQSPQTVPGNSGGAEQSPASNTLSQ